MDGEKMVSLKDFLTIIYDEERVHLAETWELIDG